MLYCVKYYIDILGKAFVFKTYGHFKTSLNCRITGLLNM